MNFTPKERYVIARLFDGLSNREIGASVGITERAAKEHVRRIGRKMGVDYHVFNLRVRIVYLLSSHSDYGRRI